MYLEDYVLNLQFSLVGKEGVMVVITNQYGHFCQTQVFLYMFTYFATVV